MTRRNAKPPPQSIEHGYEVRDTNVRWVLISGAGLTLLIVATIFLMRWTLSYFSREESVGDGPPAVLTEARPPLRGPRIDEDPQERKRMEAFIKQQDQRLNGYGTDPLTQAVHIPIERAMQLALAQGFPARQAGQQAPAQATGEAQSASSPAE